MKIVRALPGRCLGFVLIGMLLAPALLAQTSDKGPQRAIEPAKPEELPFKGMSYRNIGPFRGGRSLTASGIAGDPNTYYFGGTGSGVWKSTDGALTWQPVFDEQAVSAIGSLAVSPSDHNIVYVGTGEACIRGNISHGDGVYKTLDGGKTWKNIGLKDSRAIGKVIVHPRSSDIVFVAALGHPYGPNTERGVFRTLDGGKTWEKVLYKDENTGAIDLAIDPKNPNILFAGLWEVRRYPWTLSSGGAGSGLYRSGDGGTTWKRLEEHGLPKGPYGRVGVSVGADSEHVYALIEAEHGGLYRSDDGGDSWQLVNGNRELWQRPWYYMHVIADPQDPNVVYICNVEFYRSVDGGRTINRIRLPHGDSHGLWIDPLNPRRMIESNDGGATVTLDGGKTWTREDNQPTAQFYHVITDNRTPYYVYGAQQDNSTMAIASRSDHGAIDRSDWYPVGGGESGYIAPYPPDPNIVYAGDYEGWVDRFDKRTGQTKNITVQPELTDGGGAARLEHRFQWTAPLIISPNDPNTLYHAGESLFRTTDGGMHWEAISPDLTRNDRSKQQISGGVVTKDDTGTEYYDTIFAIAESTLSKGLIWAGTDDGLIQLTRDGGKTWNNVTPKDLPEWSRISLIEASPHDAGTTYVAADRHQNDDLHPYIYKTADYGKTWTKIVKGIPDVSFVRAVREDPKRKGLLYAGTETGVFISFNEGADWRSLQLNLPTVPVHDLVVKDNDLVLATHGRSFWILDDISPLREFSDAIAQKPVHLYTPSAAIRFHSGESRRATLAGRNPPAGAILYYFLKAEPKGETTIEILDGAGAVVRKYSSNKTEDLEGPLNPEDKKPEKQIKPKAGLNRFVWDLHYQGARHVPGYYLYEYGDGSRGPMALPGKYQVRLAVDGATQTVPLEVKLDPRVTVSPEDVQKQFDLRSQIVAQLNRIFDSVNQIQDVRTQMEGLLRRLPDDGTSKPLRVAAKELDAKLVAVRNELLDVRIEANEDSLAFPSLLDTRLAFLAMAVGEGTDSAPNEPAYRQFDKLKKLLDEQLTHWTRLQQGDLAAFQKLASERNIPAVVVAPGELLAEPCCKAGEEKGGSDASDSDDSDD
jgi:photosystem II stability/assembly factor-like uncharacterized protein